MELYYTLIDKDSILLPLIKREELLFMLILLLYIYCSQVDIQLKAAFKHMLFPSVFVMPCNVLNSRM